MAFRQVLLYLVVSVAYFLSAKLGLSFAFEQENTSPIWPPTGIAISAMIVFGFRIWPAIFAGALALNLTTGAPPLTAILIASGNTFEALFSVYLIVKFLPKYPFDSVRTIILFSLFVTIGTTVSATIGVMSLFFTNVITANSILLLWTTWWLGDTVGGLVVAPFLLTLLQKPRFPINLASSIEITILLVSVGLSLYIVFNHELLNKEIRFDSSFLLIPTLVWASLRFYQHGATLLVLLYTIIATLSTLEGFGPFVSATQNQSLLILQSFMAIIMVTSLTLAASVDETRKLVAKLNSAQNYLEEKVSLRSADLEETNSQLHQEINRREKATESLKKLLAATILPGNENYFHAVTKELTNIYKSKFAFIGMLDGAKRDRVKTISVCVDGQIVDNFEYELVHTPCKDVLSLQMEYIPSQAATLYSKDEMLLEMGVESYFGAPIISSDNKVIGIVVTMDTSAMLIDDLIRPMLGLIANNISFELEKNNAKQALQLAASVYDEAVEAIIIYDENRRIIQANRAFSDITGYKEGEAIGRDSRLLKSGKHDALFYQQFWKTLASTDSWQGEIWNQRKNGEIFPCWQTITVVKDSENKVKQYISVFSDISAKKKTEQEIYHLAHYDTLTGLANRTYFVELLERKIESAKKKDSSLALLFLDLDHFKHINDTSGHSTGDILLTKVARRLTKFVTENTIVSRLGGDEFTLLITDVNSIDSVEALASKILKELCVPYHLNSKEVVMSASIGFCLYPDDAENVHGLLKNADIAMYKAKADGRNKYKRFLPIMNYEAQQRVQIEQEIRVGLEHNQFEIYYQPQVDLMTDEVFGCEALIRWNHPVMGLLAPNSFIPVAEESGLIVPMGEWILRTVCKQFMAWKEQGYSIEQVAVNLSARQFYDNDLGESVKNLLAETGMPAGSLELELTESMLMENIDETISIMNGLRELGIHLSIDDFGTGYSSLAYLKHFPIDKLKIDRSFVNEVLTSKDDATIVKTTIDLAQGLGLKTIAEGVETAEQLAYLRKNGCEQMQGYYFCKPQAVSSPKLIELLAKTH
ncbi:MAG: EAL domain-containing protein [Kangiellaceae bacterium]